MSEAEQKIFFFRITSPLRGLKRTEHTEGAPGSPFRITSPLRGLKLSFKIANKLTQVL